MSSALTTRGSTRRWRRIRAWVLVRDEHACQLPGWSRPSPGSWAHLYAPATWPGVCAAPAEHVDHATPRAAGGGDDPAQLRASCVWHNLHRGVRDDDELLAELLATSSTSATPSTQPAAGRWSW